MIDHRSARAWRRHTGTGTATTGEDGIITRACWCAVRHFGPTALADFSGQIDPFSLRGFHHQHVQTRNISFGERRRGYQCASGGRQIKSGAVWQHSTEGFHHPNLFRFGVDLDVLPLGSYEGLLLAVDQTG